MRYTIRLCIQSRKLLRQRSMRIAELQKEKKTNRKKANRLASQAQMKATTLTIAKHSTMASQRKIDGLFFLNLKFCTRKWNGTKDLGKKKPMIWKIHYTIVYAFIFVFFVCCFEAALNENRKMVNKSKLSIWKLANAEEKENRSKTWKFRFHAEKVVKRETSYQFDFMCNWKQMTLPRSRNLFFYLSASRQNLIEAINRRRKVKDIKI